MSQRETPSGCRCTPCQKDGAHASDCAVHAAPAFPAGSCNCHTRYGCEDYVTAKFEAEKIEAAVLEDLVALVDHYEGALQAEFVGKTKAEQKVYALEGLAIALEADERHGNLSGRAEDVVALLLTAETVALVLIGAHALWRWPW